MRSGKDYPHNHAQVIEVVTPDYADKFIEANKETAKVINAWKYG